MSLFKKQQPLFEDITQPTKLTRDMEDDAEEIKKVDRVIVYGLALVLLLTPLIVRGHTFEFISPLITGTSFDTGTKFDVFTAYKYFLLIISTAVLGVIFLYKILALGYRIKKNWLNLIISCLVVVITLSAVFSPFKKLALEGMYNRHDGTISYLCYLTLFFIAANIRYTSKSLNIIIYSLIPFTLINGALGLLKIYDIDILNWGWVNSLLFGGISEVAEIHDGSNLWSTFNNPNYISGMGSILTAMFFTFMMLKEKYMEKIIFFILTLCSFTTILTSLSTSGFIALLVTMPVILIIAFLAKNKRKTVTSFLVTILSFGIILNILALQNPKVWTESIGFLINKNPYMEMNEVLDAFQLNITKTASAAEENFSLKELPESGIAPGTGRVYIWQKSIDLIKERPLFGYGLDTFFYHFPQDDPEKNAGLGDYNILVDKPHNFYIGLAFGSGIFALIGFLGLALYILINILKKFFSRGFEIEEAALAVMLVTFLVQAVFNDSIIGFTNVVFILIGILTALLLKDEEDRIQEIR